MSTPTSTRLAGSPITCCEEDCWRPVTVPYQDRTGRCAEHAAARPEGRIELSRIVGSAHIPLSERCSRPGCDRRRSVVGRLCRGCRDRLSAQTAATAPLVVEPLDTTQPIRHVAGDYMRGCLRSRPSTPSPSTPPAAPPAPTLEPEASMNAPDTQPPCCPLHPTRRQQVFGACYTCLAAVRGSVERHQSTAHIPDPGTKVRAALLLIDFDTRSDDWTEEARKLKALVLAEEERADDCGEADVTVNAGDDVPALDDLPEPEVEHFDAGEVSVGSNSSGPTTHPDREVEPGTEEGAEQPPVSVPLVVTDEDAPEDIDAQSRRLRRQIAALTARLEAVEELRAVRDLADCLDDFPSGAEVQAGISRSLPRKLPVKYSRRLLGAFDVARWDEACRELRTEAARFTTLTVAAK